jgi:hypothetical protein
MKNYITLKELIKICNIPQKTVDIILKQHKIDTYKSKRWLAVNFKDFYKVYTSLYNPSLFSYTEKKTQNKPNIEKWPKFADFESLFLYVFKRPYQGPNKKEISRQEILFKK